MSSSGGWDDADDAFYLDPPLGPGRPTSSGYGSADPPHYVAGPRAAHVSGVVRGKVERSEQQRVRYPDGSWGETALTVVSFRIDEFDVAGNRTASTPVEMRGPSYNGQLSDGDLVDAAGTLANGVLYTDAVRSRNSGAVYAVAEAQQTNPAHPKASKYGKPAVITFASLFITACFVIVISGWFGLDFGFGGSGDGGASHSPVAMPSVIGESNVSAAEILDHAGISNFVEDDVPAPASQFGKVVRTDPVAGVLVKPGQLVHVYIGGNS